ISSDEYFASRGGGTTASYLQRIYGDVLSRPIDSLGARVWGDALNSGHLSRQAVAAAILSSLESDTDEVEALYLEVLRRPVDPSGLATFSNALQAGIPNEVVLATLVGSDEYFNRF